MKEEKLQRWKFISLRKNWCSCTNLASDFNKIIFFKKKSSSAIVKSPNPRHRLQTIPLRWSIIHRLFSYECRQESTEYFLFPLRCHLKLFHFAWWHILKGGWKSKELERDFPDHDYSSDAWSAFCDYDRLQYLPSGCYLCSLPSLAVSRHDHRDNRHIKECYLKQ